MRRRVQPLNQRALTFDISTVKPPSKLGLVLSGGGARAAYQVGALRALLYNFEDPKNSLTTVVGSSIGAVNGLVFSACYKAGPQQALDMLEEMWLERTFRNTFAGSPSRSFIKAIRVAGEQFRAPGPKNTNNAIFDPTPLMNRVDEVIQAHGNLYPETRHPDLKSIGVMTTVEGETRKPLLLVCSKEKFPIETFNGAAYNVLYVDTLTSKHGFASAALPSVLPPVDFDTEDGKVKLVDGGISLNVPVDPALRMGAEKIILVDISGRDWWQERYGEPKDKHPTWEVPSPAESFCLTPPEIEIAKCVQPLGPLLKMAVGHSSKKFISAVGPVWPLFSILKNKLGEEVAYEVMTYVALEEEYAGLVIERGFNETIAKLRGKKKIEKTAA